jgi:hypothetical protein
MRRTRSLSGIWAFQLDPTGSLAMDEISPDREIPVPLPWQAAFPELSEYSGYAWYARSFDVGPEWLEGEMLLHFGAVDYWCQVFVNGTLAGEHEGGYTPFTLPITGFVHEGENGIAVRVYDVAQGEICIPRWWGRTTKGPEPAKEGRRTNEEGDALGPPFDPNDIPHGKQGWYINAGGIWQNVTLVATSRPYIANLQVTPDIHTGTAHVKVELEGIGVGADATSLRVAVFDAESRVDQVLWIEPGGKKYTAVLKVEQPHLWSSDDPHLYTVEASLRAGEVASREVIGESPTPNTHHPSPEDSLSSRFGFREIAVRDGQLLLNGEPLFLRCALDQDMYPDTIYTVPSEEFLRDQFRKARELGLNSLRCHIKPPDPLYLDLADEMGLLVWAEIPSWRTFYVKGTLHEEQRDLGDAVKRRVETTLEEMVRRDFNHPSLVIWTIVNEDWGTSLPLSAADRAWVKEMYHRCKALDPTRLVVDNSACPHAWGPNIHVKSDLDDFHLYANIPDQAGWFEQAVEQFALRPLWTYSSQGDAERTGDEPLVLSEFGNWGLPAIGARGWGLGAGKDELPWFDIGPWWSAWEGEPGWPAGVLERFERLGLQDIWSSYDEFAVATQWHQFAALKFEIEAMRRRPGLEGYVITELSDIYWESNGLLDFYRNPKVYHERFAEIDGADIVMGRPDSYAYWHDQMVHAQLYASHFSPRNWSGARLKWSHAGESGEEEMMEVRRGEARPLGTHSLPLQAVEKTTGVPIGLQVVSNSGEELARNSVDLLVLPASTRRAGYRGEVAVVTKDEGISGRPPSFLRRLRTLRPSSPEPRLPGLGGAMGKLGYQVSGKITADTRIAVTSHPTEGLLRWVRDGGKLLYLNEGVSPFFWAQGRGGSYSGNWLTAFSWLRPEVHPRLQVNNPLGLPYMRVMPERTILGLPVEDRAVQADFLAGQISGWVGHPAVHTVRFRYGKGKVIMTTFNIAANAGRDPVATAMLHDLVDHLASEACEPALKSNH